jgi:hypothetical protein
VCAFVAAVTFLKSRCLSTIEDTHIDTDWWEGFMKYAVEMGSGAMIYIKSLIKIGLAIQKLMGRGIRRHTDSLLIHKRNFIFFKIMKVDQKSLKISNLFF